MDHKTSLFLCFKTSLSLNVSYENEFFMECNFYGNQSHFHRNDLHLDWLCNRGSRELGNSLFCGFLYPFLVSSVILCFRRVEELF